MTLYRHLARFKQRLVQLTIANEYLSKYMTGEQVSRQDFLISSIAARGSSNTPLCHHFHIRKILVKYHYYPCIIQSLYKCPIPYHMWDAIPDHFDYIHHKIKNTNLHCDGSMMFFLISGTSTSKFDPVFNSLIKLILLSVTVSLLYN